MSISGVAASTGGLIRSTLGAAAASPTQDAPTDPALLARLTAMETQLAAIAAVVGAIPAESNAARLDDAPQVGSAPTEPAPPTQEAAPATDAPIAEQAAAPAITDSGWRDEVSYSLPPGEGGEIKLVMQAGESARFEWTANGGVLNYDTHGDDGGDNSVSYEKGHAVAEQAGALNPTFSGNHGWFWRNRSDAPVTLTLRTGGQYAQIKVP